MKNTCKYLAISSLLLFLASCEQAFMTPTPASDPEAIFDQVWNFADTKYSFFDLKKVDWNASKTKFKAKISKDMSDEALFKVCDDMLYDLKDEHVNLSSKFNISHNREVFLDFPTNYNGDNLTRNYFNNGKTQAVERTFRLFDFGDVLYVSYSSFSDNVSDYAMDYICEKAAGKKGLILDVRQNGGGSVGNINAIAGRFVDKKTFAGVEYIKTGPGREDFRKDTIFVTPPVSATAKKYTTKPIVVLTNRGCYSATNFFTMSAKAIPNVTVIGGKTGGGGGIPATTELSNGWTLRVSASRTFDKEGRNIEIGVDPNIALDISEADKLKGRDTILDRALKVVREK